MRLLPQLPSLSYLKKRWLLAQTDAEIEMKASVPVDLSDAIARTMKSSD